MNNHPKIDFPTSKKSKLMNILSVIAILGTFIYVIVVYPTLPETIPTHFNLAGEVDGWGGKNSIFIVPFISIVMFILLYFLSKVPHTFNLPATITEENAARIYPVAQFFMCVFNLETVLLFSYLAFASIPGVLSLGNWFFPIFILAFILTIILFVRKIKRLE